MKLVQYCINFMKFPKLKAFQTLLDIRCLTIVSRFTKEEGKLKFY